MNFSLHCRTHPKSLNFNSLKATWHKGRRFQLIRGGKFGKTVGIPSISPLPRCFYVITLHVYMGNLLALFGERPDPMTQNSKKNLILFLSKLIPIFLLFISNQSFFIIIQIKKSLQNIFFFKLFYTKYYYIFFSHQLNLL
jgi:hypothetical protein